MLKMQRNALAEHTPACPDETALAGFLDRGVAEGERQRLGKHIAECDHCIGQVAFLAKAAEPSEAAVLPAHVLVRARALGAAQRPRVLLLGWPWAAASAATAVLAIAVGVSVLQRDEQIPAPITPGPPSVEQPQITPAPATKVESPRKVRGPEAIAVEPRVASPREGEVLGPGQLEFRWEPVREALTYEVTLVTEEGSSLWAASTEATRMKPPAELKLEPGRKYFVWVVAHVAGGRSVKSRAVAFQIRESQ
jgi:hypothetical protein